MKILELVMARGHASDCCHIVESLPFPLQQNLDVKLNSRKDCVPGIITIMENG